MAKRSQSPAPPEAPPSGDREAVLDWLVWNDRTRFYGPYTDDERAKRGMDPLSTEALRQHVARHVSDHGA